MNNLSKILWYLSKVTKKPIIADGEEYWDGITGIRLAPTLFDTDGCEVCGDCCCVHEDNVYTKHEYDKIMNMTDEEFRAEGYEFDSEGFNPEYLHNLRAKIGEEKHVVNGTEITLYVRPKDNSVNLTRTHRTITTKEGYEYPRCVYTRRDPDGLTKCSIHPVRSITCDMPHLKFIYRKNSSLSIGIAQYGRNWAMGCPVKFHSPRDEEEFQHNKSNVLRKLNHLKKNADDLMIDTYLPKVIDYIEKIPYEGYEKYLNKFVIGSANAETNENLFEI